MDNQTYKDLVNNSESFKTLNESLKKPILSAEGERREKYVKFFLSEKEHLMGIKREFLEKNEAVVTKLKEDFDKEKSQYLKKAEEAIVDYEEDKMEDLLNQ